MTICALCKKPIPNGVPESWVTHEGETIHVERTAGPSIIAETTIGELEICESCYQRTLPSFFTPDDLAEIHYQFGLEYRTRHQLGRSFESLTRARAFIESSSILAALASTENELGHRCVAISLYQRALEIDPNHFISRQNLDVLRAGCG